MSNVLDNEGFTAKKYLLRPETMRPKLLRPILTIFLRHCIFLIPIFLRQRPRLVFKSKIFDTETLKIIGTCPFKSLHCKLELGIYYENCLFELKVLDAFAVQVLPRS